MQISLVKPGNQMEVGMEVWGEGGGGGEMREGTRAKPGNQLVVYIA